MDRSQRGGAGGISRREWEQARDALEVGRMHGVENPLAELARSDAFAGRMHGHDAVQVNERPAVFLDHFEFGKVQQELLAACAAERGLP